MSALQTEVKDDKMAIINDPFGKSCIESISIRMTKLYGGKLWFYADVEFKNGNTEGKQRIEGSDLTDVYLKVKAFVESL